MDHKNRNGITLVALIITIIVMLILAGVSLNALVGDNGLITNAQEAKFKSAMSQYLEDTEAYAVSLEGAAASGEDVYYDETEGARKYFYAGDISSSGNTTYAERFQESFLNIAEITSGSIALKNVSWDSFTKMDDSYYRSKLAVEEGYLTWFCDSENDNNYENEVKWCLDVGLKVFDINRGYITSIDGSGNIVADVGSDGSYGNGVGKSSGVQSNGVYCCSPDLSTGWNTGKTYYVTYPTVDTTSKAKIDPSGFIYKTAPSDWYDYGANKYANVMTVSHGEVSYWTWIPRYAVKINPGTGLVETINGKTDVRYVDTNNQYSTIVDGVLNTYAATDPEMANYIVPDAFTFDGKALSGIWVAKYELTVPAEAIGFNSMSGYGSITITSLTFEGNRFSSDAEEDIRQSEIDIYADGVKQNGDNESVILGKVVNGNDYTNGYTINFTNKNKAEHEIKIVIKSKLGIEEMNLNVVKKVWTTEGTMDFATTIAGVENIVDPDVYGFVQDPSDPTKVTGGNAYYFVETYDSSKGKWIWGKGEKITADITTDSETGMKRAHATNVPTASSTQKAWYDYGNKRWANIVTLNESSSDSDLNGQMALWVWIPRFEFKVDSSLNSVESVFIPQSKTVPDSGYSIPDAFTFDGKPLAGIWVAKYELSNPRLPIGVTVKATDRGFKILNIVYSDGTKGSDEIQGGKISVLSADGSDVIVGETSFTANSSSGTVITLPSTAQSGMYRLKVTVNRSYALVGGNAKPIEFTQDIYIQATESANPPELDGFGKTEYNAYYVYYPDGVDKAGKIYGPIFNQTKDTGGHVTSFTVNDAPSGWYDYNNGKYANILITKSTLSQNTVCDENGLKNAENVTMWTWIPRYQFRVENSSMVNWINRNWKCFRC